MDKVNGKTLFPRVGEFKTRGHIFNVKGEKFKRDLRSNFLTQKMVHMWNELLAEVVETAEDSPHKGRKSLDKWLVPDIAVLNPKEERTLTLTREDDDRSVEDDETSMSDQPTKYHSSFQCNSQREYCVQFWNPYYWRNVIALERVQVGFIRMFLGQQSFGCDERSDRLGLFSLEQRRLRGYMIEMYKNKGGIDEPPILGTTGVKPCSLLPRNSLSPTLRPQDSRPPRRTDMASSRPTVTSAWTSSLK
eukprot:g31002.t1